MPRRIPGFGWKPDLPDHRDYLYRPTAVRILPEVDLRPNMPAVYDQGHLGSCTANAIGAALEYLQVKQGESAWTPSRLAIYWHERNLEGTTGQDAGAYIRDGIKVVAAGYAPETLWPYNISRYAETPPTEYEHAATTQALTYYRITGTGRLRTHAIQTALSQGLPVVFGFTVYQSFESDTANTTGVISYPHPDETILGGHAVLCVGYHKVGRSMRYICRNSWGDTWGDNGYFHMPSRYISSAQLADDLWVITSET